MGEQSSSANLADFFGDIIEEAGIGDIAKEVGLPFGGSRSGESDSNAFASMMGGESSSQGAYGDTGAMGIPYAAAFSASNAARSRRGSRFYTYCRFCKGNVHASTYTLLICPPPCRARPSGACVSVSPGRGGSTAP